MAWGAAGIAGAGLIGGMLSSKSASKAARQAASTAAAESGRQFDVSMEEMREAAEYLESIGVPPAEAQRIALEYAQVGPSAMEEIETDPRLRSAQMDALAQMQEMGAPGLTGEERAQQMMITRGSGAQAQARDKAILQNMAERGMGGSGAELIARLQGSQSAADRASVQQAQLSGQAQSRALQAMSQRADRPVVPAAHGDPAELRLDGRAQPRRRLLGFRVVVDVGVVALDRICVDCGHEVSFSIVLRPRHRPSQRARSAVHSRSE